MAESTVLKIVFARLQWNFARASSFWHNFGNGADTRVPRSFYSPNRPTVWA